MKKLDILYNANSKYLNYVIASMISVIENSKIDKLVFHIIYENFTFEDFNSLLKLKEKYSVKIKIYDVRNVNLSKLGINPWKETQIGNARLFFQDIMGTKNLKGVDTLLYLDADTIVKKSLCPLLDNTVTLSCVPDVGLMKSQSKSLGVKGTYYNSGVILINVKEWIREGYQKRIYDYIKDNSEKIKKLEHPDQDILNAALSDSISPLPLEYNMPMYQELFNDFEMRLFLNKNRTITYKEYKRSEAVILHAYTIYGLTPFTDNHVNPYNEDFLEYLTKYSPEFEKLPLNEVQKCLDNPLMFKLFIIIRGYVPDKVITTTKEHLRKRKLYDDKSNK